MEEPILAVSCQKCSKCYLNGQEMTGGSRVQMTKQHSDDRRLARLTTICLALPEATRTPCGTHSSFLVRKKTFAYFLDNHHGDGIVGVTCKVLPGDNTVLIA